MTKVFNIKGTPTVKTKKRVIKKGYKKNPPEQMNDDKYARKKVPPPKGKKETKTMNKNLQLL